MNAFLRSMKPIIISREKFARVGSLGSCSSDIGRNPVLASKAWFSDSDRTSSNEESAICIPPLNTDIRFSSILPVHVLTSDGELHPHGLHVHERYAENFSWSETTDEDDETIVEKKKLISPIQNQHLCGSCWAMAMAAVVSDCFVVSGLVNWMPDIASTFIMMAVPQQRGNGQCNGGNPAEVALALETIPVADSSCIDYSWCSNDKELCTSSSAASHFQSTLGDKLNENIPKAERDLGACYFPAEKFLYQIDSGSDVCFVENDSPEQFRATVKAHIVDFGPTLAGYAVLKNFLSGNFTDPHVNCGIYFERADYSAHSNKLNFNDVSEFDISGFHAVRVVGWGLGKNVQYDVDKFGDVPYWVAANSWGDHWGKMNGFFKIAMYPFNKLAQFDSQVIVKGFPIGGMILVRATTAPTLSSLPQIQKRFLERIKRMREDSHYMKNESVNRETAPKFENGFWIGIAAMIIAIVAFIFVVGWRKR